MVVLSIIWTAPGYSYTVVDTETIQAGLLNYKEANIPNTHKPSLSLAQNLSKDALLEMLTKYIYHFQSLSQDKMTEEEIMDFICSGRNARNHKVSHCRKKERKILSSLIKYALSKNIENNPISLAEIVNIQSERIKLQNILLLRINQTKLETKKSKAYLKANIQNLSPEQNKLYEEYLALCLSNLNTKHGTLLMSSFYQEEFGHCRKLEINDLDGLSYQKNTYLFNLHEYPSIDDIKRSKRSLLVSYRYTLKELRKNFLKTLNLRQGSNALEQVKIAILNSQDSLPKNIRSKRDLTSIQFALQSIEKDEKRHKTFKKIGNGLLIASSLTGLGSIAVSIAAITAKSLLRAAVIQGGKRHLKKQSFKGFNKYLTRSMYARKADKMAKGLLTVSAATSIAQNPFLILTREREKNAFEFLKTQIFALAITNRLDNGKFQEMKGLYDLLDQEINTSEWNLIFNTVFLPIEALIVFKTFKAPVANSEALLNYIGKHPSLSPSELNGLQSYLISLSPAMRIEFFETLGKTSPDKAIPFIAGVIRENKINQNLFPITTLGLNAFEKTKYVNPGYGVYRLGRWVKGQFKNFVSEVKKQGAIRLAIAPRDGKKKFDVFNSVMNPVIDFPVEVINQLKVRVLKKPPVKKQASLLVSAPTGALFYITVLPYIVRENYFDDVTEKFVKNVDESKVGATYLSQWAVQAQIDIFNASAKLEELHMAITNDYIEYFVPRIDQLIQMGFIRRADVPTLIKILKNTLAIFNDDYIPTDHEIYNAFYEEAARSELKEIINPNKEALTQFMFYPTVKLYDMPDLIWYGYFVNEKQKLHLSENHQRALRSLNPILYRQDISMTTVIMFFADSVHNNEIMDARIQRAQRLGIDKDMGDALYRIPIPLADGEFSYHKMNETFQAKDELDLWNILLTDPRFKTVANAYKNQQIDDITALMEVKYRILNDNPYFETFQNSKQEQLTLTLPEACTIIHSEAPPVEINSYKNLLNAPDFENKSKEEKATLLFLLTQNLYQYTIQSAQTQDEREIAKVYATTKVNEQNYVGTFANENIFKLIQTQGGLKTYQCP